MIFSELDMVKQRRPAGPMYRIDEEWKRDILALLEKRGIRRSELARLIDVDPASITVLFRPATAQSRLVPAIHKVLGLDPPTSTLIAEKNDAMSRLTRACRNLDGEAMELLIAMASRVSTKR